MRIDIHNHLNYYSSGGPQTRWDRPPVGLEGQVDVERLLERTMWDLVGDWLGVHDSAGIDMAFAFDWNNDDCLTLCEQNPDRFRGLVVVDPRDTALSMTKVDKFLSSGKFVGVKIAGVPDYSSDGEPYAVNDPSCFEFYEYCAELKLPILFHTGAIFVNPPGGPRNLVKYCRPLDLDEIARTFHGLPVVVGHAGRPLWQETLCMANQENVWIDLTWSQLPLPLYRESVRVALEGFGPGRTMFGSDSNPWRPDRCKTLADETKSLLSQFDVSDEDLQQIFGGTAATLFLRDAGPVNP